MQKTGIILNRKTVIQTGKIIPVGSKPTRLMSEKVNKANLKVNSANAQSASGGFHLRRQMVSCVLSTSKRFQYLKTACPDASCYEEKRAPKLAFLKDNFTEIKMR